MKNILLSAPLLSNSGYGVHSRQVFSYLKTIPNAKIYCNILEWGSLPWHLSDEYTSGSFSQIIDSYIPESMINNLKFDECYTVSYPHEWLFYGDKNIGITAGVETDIVPFHWMKFLNKADVVICTSEFTANAFYKTAENKNFKLNKSINVVHQYYHEEFDKSDIVNIDCLDKINTKNNLLLIGQLTSINNNLDRKNTFNSIESLVRILSTIKDSGLVIKTSLGSNSYLDFVKIKKLFAKYKESLKEELGENIPQIYLLHGNMTPLELKSLYSSDKISGLVSLTRGEGFGLTLLEAASCGLPIIATNYSAYKEFLNESFLKIDYRLENVPKEKIDNKIFAKNSLWCEYENKSLHVNVLNFFNNVDLYNNISIDLQEFIKNNFNKESILNKYKLCLN